MKLKIPLLIYCFFNLTLIADMQIEEIITTGSILNNPAENSSPLDIIDQDDLNDLNIITIGEISKYIASSTGSQFQTNALDGTDQGMSSITLRGLDHTSTLVLINSKRQTSAGTTSNEGEGYVDINIIPQIALKQVHILKEGATTAYGSDAISGVVNFLTQDDFGGVKLNLNQQKTTNYNQRDSSLGILFGKKYDNSNFVFAIDYIDRSPLNASEIPGIAELGLSTLGNSFKVSADDVVDSGVYQGSYSENQWVADPNCINNGGILAGPFCKFLYGERFNIINTEEHIKSYLSYKFDAESYQSKTTLIYADISVKDNPQSPSYPALSFLSRKIQPGIGGSPFNVPVTWYGRPLGSAYPSPNSPKDISQYHLSHVITFDVNEISDIEISITNSRHSNIHNRPDT
ncbi:TonB-dependent receptor plug domain-containing protein, partial [Gammaproteobacteria bacterium]|nr:TonB-dependent receptor plug domain-containing protein [Gammaproteobacteria bacterium]